jgi:AcrR family transcriptional regulator
MLIGSPSIAQDTAGPAPLRADARRNRLRLLAAAEEAFAEEGLGVPVDEIARRAGVGPGTLYRHFPTKEALFEAVIIEHMQSLAERAEEVSGADDPTTALFDFLGYLADQGASKRNLVDALSGLGIDVKASPAIPKARLDAAIESLLKRAQESGGVRADVTMADLVGLVVGVCSFSGTEAEASSQRRMLDVVCTGLRARA